MDTRHKTTNGFNIFSFCKSALLVLAITVFGLTANAQQPPQSGISGNTVILNDLEDHTWTYYSTTKPDSDYPDALRSPDPRNVKITYRGGSVNNASAVAVSVTEPQNEFVYYKTIEKLAWGNSTGRWLIGNYAYRTIPNPFSKRPRTNGSTGTNGFWGFNGWKVISGGGFINEYGDGGTIPADQVIHFVNLPEGNDSYGEIVLEAQWTAASVVTSLNNVGSLGGTSYETNFVVFTDGGNKNVTNLSKPATVSNRYPDGTVAGSSTVQNFTTNGNTVKLEYVMIGDGITPTHPIDYTTSYTPSNGSGTFTAGGAGELIVGRGCTGTVTFVTSSNNGQKYSFRIESGKYAYMHPMYNGGQGNNNVNNWGRVVLGCDYDRAADDGISGNGTGDNTKLRVVNYVSINRTGATGDNDSELMDITVKSGYYGYSANYGLYNGSGSLDGYGLGIGGNTDGYDVTFTTTGPTGTVNYLYADVNNENTNPSSWVQTLSFYAGTTRAAGKGGVNRMLVEGGEFNSINGGGGRPGPEDNNNTDNVIGFHFRMKGGWVKGAVYGTASISNSRGSRKLVFTGGEVNGWVAGGCNGTDFGNGQGYNHGTCYIYGGGRTEFRSHDGNGTYNNAYGLVFNVPGGQIFGAGRGLAPQANNDPTYCGSTTTAYVVVADEAEVEQNVYGGGYNGVSQNSYVYILGGTIGKKVFGGTAKAISTDNTWRCRNTDIRMYDGIVKGGIYGGHDETGIQYNDANVQIYGGTIGSTVESADVFGGGYGQATRVNGDVDVTLGTCDATTGVTVFGDVYGGSALGNVNTNANNTTTVSLYKGTIYGGLYGGGLGSESVSASVYGNVYVKVYGGSVLCSAADPVGEAGTGSVFGCNNVNGAPLNRVAVDIYSTDQPTSGYALHAVYGGGNKAAYTGVPVVTVHGCNNSIEYVYGGGNATDVSGTDVTIWGGTIGNAFGGGNGFSAAEPPNHTNPSGPHYNPGANITDEGTNLKIYGGEIGAAFGGSNQFGTINSTIDVTVDTKTEPGNDPCSGDAYEGCNLVIDELYGGGNEAPIQTSSGGWIVPRVVVLACDAYIKNFFGGAKAANYVGDIETNIVAGRFDNVFGGNNKGGEIKGNVTLNLRGGTIGNAFGGCNEKGDILGYITVNVIDGETECPLYITNVYGGGQDASYRPTLPTEPYIISPKVNINHTRRGTSVAGSVYGGGKGADAVVTANPYVTVGDDNDNHYSIVSGEVYGGGNAAAVKGNTEVLIKNRAKVIGNIYGGGNMGAVDGDTKVIINGRIN